MLIASNRGLGMNVGFPDVCNTPVGPATVPVPYPNIGMNTMAAPFSPNVRLSMVNAVNLGSMIPVTTGDEGGVAHPMIKGPSRYSVGNPVVNVNMLPGINLTCPSSGNNMNNAMGAVLVPSITNVFYTFRTTQAQADLDTTAGRLLSAAETEHLSSLSMSSPARINAIVFDDGIGYIEVPAFSAEMPTRVCRVMRELQQRGALGLVLDLRDNPGGELDSFLRLAEEFLSEGKILCRKLDADGDEIVVRARHEMGYGISLCVLVNANTASAAELFAGCLQSHGRAIVIGNKTYGKGLLRTVVSTQSGFVEADVALCLLPNGETIHGIGLSPDIDIDGDDKGNDHSTDQAILMARAELLRRLENRE